MSFISGAFSFTIRRKASMRNAPFGLAGEEPVRVIRASLVERARISAKRVARPLREPGRSAAETQCLEEEANSRAREPQRAPGGRSTKRGP